MHDEAVKLATIMLTRKFKEELPKKFWNNAKYKPEFQHQMRLALKLLKVYDFDVVMTSISEMKWCYSLAVKKLESDIYIRQELKNKKPDQKEFKKSESNLTFRKNKSDNIKNG